MPFIIPTIFFILLLFNDLFKGSIIGIPPQTAASDNIYTPSLDAVLYISSPYLAMTALFAVTTDLPNFNDCRIISFAKSTPPITSTITSIEGSLINLNGSSVNKLLSSSISLFLLRSLTAIFAISISFRIGCESTSELNIL